MLLVMLAALAQPARAVDFEVQGLQTLINFDVSYGARYRLQAADAALVGVANGGQRGSVNNDDGTLNYGTGSVSQMLRGTAEVIALYGNLSFYGRAVAFHDWEQDGALERTRLSPEGRELVANGVDLLDFYFGTSLSLGGIPVYLRVGDQVVNWSGSSFIRDGLDLINPVDIARASQPASQPLDGRTPQGMVWLAAGLSDIVAVEGYYQYEWKPAVLPPVGSYLSGADLFGGDGLGTLFLGGGATSDLGTNLDQFFALPAGTLGYDEDFNGMPGLAVGEPSAQGQFGVALIARWLGGLAPKLGLHYIRYHSRLPLISSVTASGAAVAATSEAAVAERAAGLEPSFLATGLAPAEAAREARLAAEALTISAYGNAAGFRVDYPTDVQAIGASLSLASMRTGTLLSAEISHHMDVPYQLSIGAVSTAALSPIEFDPTIGSTPLGEFGADETIRGYRRSDRTQAALGLTRILGQRFGADTVLSGIALGWVHIHDVPTPEEVPYESSGREKDSWGAQIFIAATYNSVIGGLNLTPRLAYARDNGGSTPAPYSTFLEDRSVFSAGIRAEYLQNYELDLSYVRFMGAGGANLLRDRDYLQLRLTAYF